jgi:hypothetical protein
MVDAFLAAIPDSTGAGQRRCRVNRLGLRRRPAATRRAAADTNCGIEKKFPGDIFKSESEGSPTRPAGCFRLSGRRTQSWWPVAGRAGLGPGPRPRRRAGAGKRRAAPGPAWLRRLTVLGMLGLNLRLISGYESESGPLPVSSLILPRPASGPGPGRAGRTVKAAALTQCYSAPAPDGSGWLPSH